MDKVQVMLEAAGDAEYKIVDSGTHRVVAKAVKEALAPYAKAFKKAVAMVKKFGFTANGTVEITSSEVEKLGNVPFPFSILAPVGKRVICFEFEVTKAADQPLLDGVYYGSSMSAPAENFIANDVISLLFGDKVDLNTLTTKAFKGTARRAARLTPEQKHNAAKTWTTRKNSKDNKIMKDGPGSPVHEFWEKNGRSQKTKKVGPKATNTK